MDAKSQHQTHERARYVAQAKEHDLSLKEPILSFEGCFPLIPWTNAYLMVPTTKFQFGKDSGPF